MSETKKSFHYGYLIVLTFVVTSFGPLSLGLSCAGLFFTPVANEFAANPGTVSYYFSFMYIASIITLPFLGKLLAKQDARVFASAAVVIMAVALVAQSFTQAVWQYLACGVVVGVAVTMLLFLAPSTVINRWFKVRSGFFVGLTMAFTGVGGVVWNAVGGVLLNSFGWRPTLLVFAGLVLLLGLPFTMFVLRSNPADKGLLPFGADECSAEQGAPAEEGVDAPRAFKSTAFLLLCAFAFLLNFGMYAYQMFPSYMSSLPLSAALPLLGATAASVAMAGQTIGKLVLGSVGEKNPGAVVVTAIGLGAAGLIIITAFTQSQFVLYSGVALYGIYYALTNVMMPVLTRRFFGIKDYSIIYARISMAASIGIVISTFAWGTVVKVFGYAPMFLGIVAVLALAAVVVLAAIKKADAI